jgi:hypothetical protein
MTFAIRSTTLLAASTVIGVACALRTPAPTPAQQPEYRIHTGPAIKPAGERTVIQFNDEPPIVYVSDGKGGPAIIYHGEPLRDEQVKSIRSLTANEARQRFGDATLTGAVLIALK